MKKQLTFFSIIIFLALGFFFANSAYADTEISGNITSNTTWTLANSPYVVIDTIQVPENITLTIEPGVIVKFSRSTGLLVGGKLVANGNANNHIIFTSSQNMPQPSDWDRIRFIQTADRLVVDADKNYISGSILNYSDIQYGGRTLDIDNGMPYISNSNLNNNYQLILYSNLAGVLKNSTIENNGRVDVGRNYSMINSTARNNQEFYGQDSGIIKYSTLNNNDKLTLSNSTIVSNNIFNNKTSEGLIRISQDVNIHEVKFNTFRENGDGTKNLVEINYGNREISFNFSNNNIIEDHNKYLVNNQNNSSFTSQYNFSKNYWGTTNLQEISNKIYDYYDSITYGKVNYEPYALTELKFDATDTFSQSEVCASWTYSDWSACSSNSQQTRSIISSSPSGCADGSPVLTQSCTYIPPVCTSWTYSGWGACANNQQTRTITSSQPTNCAGGNPILSQSCNSIPLCTENNWTSTLMPTNCPISGQQTKTWSKIGQCQRGVSHPSEEAISCNYQIPTCSNFTYGDWGACSSSGVQSRTMLSTSPSGCAGGNPVLSQNCTYIPPVCTSWTYSDWNACINGWQTRAINSSSPNNCAGGSPVVSQACQLEAEIKNVEIANNNNQTAENNNANNSNSETNSSGKNSIEKETKQTTNQQDQIQEQTQNDSHTNQTGKQEQVLKPEQNSPNNKAETDKSENILEQKRSIVANAVQEMVKVADRNSGVGEKIKTIAQTQNQNQEQLETSTQKIQTRSGFAKFFIGPDYGEIKKSQKLLEQNKEQVRQLNQLMPQVTSQDDQKQITEQIQRLEQVNQQTETSLNEAQKGFSILGWIFRLFAK